MQMRRFVNEQRLLPGSENRPPAVEHDAVLPVPAWREANAVYTLLRHQFLLRFPCLFS
jgi:hypothetical protein